jgi:Prokaryotic metallothionein
VLFRLFAFGFAVYVLILLIKAYLSVKKASLKLRRDAKADAGEEMVLDPQCNSYVPRSAAVRRDGNYFCSQECAQLFLSR